MRIVVEKLFDISSLETDQAMFRWLNSVIPWLSDRINSESDPEVKAALTAWLKTFQRNLNDMNEQREL